MSGGQGHKWLCGHTIKKLGFWRRVDRWSEEFIYTGHYTPAEPTLGTGINYGEGGGLQDGKIAGRELFASPSRQGQTFRAPPPFFK